MQIRTPPTQVYPQLPGNQPRQRQVSPVTPRHERHQQPDLPVTGTGRGHELAVIKKGQSSRYSYVRVDNDISRAGQALRTYFEIETQRERERSELLLGIDVTV